MPGRMSHEPAGQERVSLVLMGSLSAAAQFFDFIREHPRLDLVAMVCRDDNRREPGESYAIDKARENGVPVHSLETMPAADLGLAIRFDQILQQRHLDRFGRGVINLHGAPLPEMRGSMCECAAILEGASHFGASLHLMDGGVDTGAILCVERFEIAPDATAGALLREANCKGLKLVRDHIDAFLDGQLEPMAQDKAAGRTYRQAELLRIRNAPPGLNPLHRDRVRRAFHYASEPPGGSRILRRLAHSLGSKKPVFPRNGEPQRGSPC